MLCTSSLDVFPSTLPSSRCVSWVVVTVGPDWCLPIRSNITGDLTFLQIDKCERCKHDGFALSCCCCGRISQRLWFDLPSLSTAAKKQWRLWSMIFYMCVFDRLHTDCVVFTFTHHHHLSKSFLAFFIPALLLIAYPWFNRSFPRT